MTTRIKCFALMVAMIAALMAGCSSNPPAQQADNSTPGNAPQPDSGAGSSANAAKQQNPASITVPAGTELTVRLVGGIDSGTAEAGSSFEATLAAPLVVNGMEGAAVGSAVTGTVTHAVSSGRLNRPAELALTLTSLTPRGGASVNLTTSTWSAKGESHKKRNVEMIGGGAAGGALIGALAGGKKGAGIGTLVGGGGGTAVAAGTGKKEIKLASETKLNFTLREAVTLPTR